VRRTHYPLILLLLIGLVCSCARTVVERQGAGTKLDPQTIAALNRLRDDVNAAYGYREGVPRVNLGPCGRFAKAFREQWNTRFSEKINIAFVMSQDNGMCHHVVVRLPDGSYFDGGNGTITGEKLTSLWPGSHIEEMTKFDLQTLDKRSYGLRREYPVCPNYSDELTDKMIERCLTAMLAAGYR
jgi:hypothetical protein